MSAWSALPNELLLHILWLSDYKDVLRVRLVNRRCKELIDSSSQLNLLVELGRDGQYPIYSAGFNKTAMEVLDLHLRKRDRWSQFIQPIPRLMPLQDHEFHIYEFAGGLLAACIAGSTTDTISIQSTETREGVHEYEDPLEVYAGRKVPLPFKCAEFSFDPTQDLLVVVEDLIPKFPVHIFSLLTNTYHSKAAQPIFDKFVDTTTPHGIDIEITIDESIVSLAYRPVELFGNVYTAVLNWKTGQVLFNQAISGATSASLMSPRYLMAVRCGYAVFNSSLDIYNLASDGASQDTQVPFFRLSLPELCRRPPNTTDSSYFIHSTQNSSYAYSLNGIARNGETDLICIQIRINTEELAETARLYLFVSKKRLLQLVSTVFGQRSEANLNPVTIQKDSNRIEIGPDHSGATASSATNERGPIRRISYNEWSDSGRFVRWIDGSNLHGMTRCGVFGSKFACIGSPYDLGLPPDTIFDNSDSQFVCMLEFNERLLSNREGQDGPNTLGVPQPDSDLLESIDADVHGGLSYKIKWFENPTTDPCFDLLLGSDCVMVRLREGFEVYKI